MLSANFDNCGRKVQIRAFGNAISASNVLLPSIFLLIYSWSGIGNGIAIKRRSSASI